MEVQYDIQSKCFMLLLHHEQTLTAAVVEHRRSELSQMRRRRSRNELLRIEDQSATTESDQTTTERNAQLLQRVHCVEGIGNRWATDSLQAVEQFPNCKRSSSSSDQAIEAVTTVPHHQQ